MILAELTIFPVGKGESLSAYVARVLDIIDRSGLPYRVNPMGTVLEGEWDQVMGVIRSCYDALALDCNRISLLIRLDYRKGTVSRMDAKVEALEQKIQRPLKK